MAGRSGRLRARVSRLGRILQLLWEYSWWLIQHPSRTLPVAVRFLEKRPHLGEYLRLERNQKIFSEAPPEILIDVGANTGQFASAAVAVFPTLSTVVAVEPLPDCLSRIEDYFAGSRIELLCHPVAAGAETRRAQFERVSFSEASSLLPLDTLHHEAFPFARDASAVEVEVRPLDSLGLASALPLDSATVLLKVDVQGTELDALRGATELLAKTTWVWIETSMAPLYVGQSWFDDVYGFLRRQGFEYVGAMDQLRQSPRGRVLQQDSLFQRAAAR